MSAHTMTTLLTKKMGEVEAFATVGIHTFTKGGDALNQTLGKKYVVGVIAHDEQDRETLQTIAKHYGKDNDIRHNADKTEKKFLAMESIYLEDKWSEPTEVMEWLGFFEGSAMVHWNLVLELATEEDIAPLIAAAKSSYAFHKTLHATITKAIREAV